MIEKTCPCCGEIVRAERPQTRPRCHKVLCGDATRADDVQRLMAGARASICFTSPPYGVGGSASLSGNKATIARGSKYLSDEDADATAWRR